MRLWMRISWLACLGALSAAWLIACGGSSSETPEPVRPDAWQFRARHRSQLAAAKASASEPNRELTRGEGFDVPFPARSTWGASGIRPNSAPKTSAALAFPDEPATAREGQGNESPRTEGATDDKRKQDGKSKTTARRKNGGRHPRGQVGSDAKPSKTVDDAKAVSPQIPAQANAPKSAPQTTPAR